MTSSLASCGGLFAVLVVASSLAQAAVEMGAPFSDGMVLQQGMEVRLVRRRVPFRSRRARRALARESA